jgi:hypothetical protein
LNLGSNNKRAVYAYLMILAFLGLAIRSYGIGGIEFWYDEMGLWLYSVTGTASPPSEPPLMPWLLYLWMWWMKSADPFHIHFLPVVLGSLTIPLSYALASKVAESRISGLVAAALTTVSPMAIFYSREGRPYALFILVSGALYLSLIRANERDSKRAWLVYSLVFCSCGLSHLLTIEIAVALGIFAVAIRFIGRLTEESAEFRARRFIHFLLFSLAGGAGILWIVQREAGPIVRAFAGVYEYGWISFLRDVLVNLGPGPVGPSVDPSFGLPEFLGVVFGVLFLAGLWRLHQEQRDDLGLLFVLAVSVPLLVKYFTLGWRGSWDWMRYMSHSLLPFLVVVSVGVEFVCGRFFKRAAVRFAVVALLVTSIVPAAIELPERSEYGEYESIARYIRENAERLEGVLVLPYSHDIGPGDPRITNIYYNLKRELLPVYHLTEGEIRKLTLVPTRGNVTRIPQANRDSETSLKSGKYAVLWRRSFEDCDFIPRWLDNLEAKAKESSPIMNGLTICDLDFFD